MRKFTGIPVEQQEWFTQEHYLPVYIPQEPLMCYEYKEPTAPRWFTLLCTLIGVCLILAMLGHATEQDQKAADWEFCYTHEPNWAKDDMVWLNNCMKNKRKERENGTSN